MDITIEIKSVFGNELIYPVCEKAKVFADLCAKKTLSRNNLRDIKKLGYEIKTTNAYKLADL